LKLVPTETVETQDELTNVFGAYIGHGFEGMMVRNAQARYKNSRSHDLLKVKIMQDAEFELVRIEEGRGKMAGKAIFTCVTEDGKEFRCKLVGALDSLKQYVDEPEKWLGKPVTVKYQNLSADGIPRFPIALRFREDV
jgi:ATP-dependent DNA ligase